MFGYFWHSPLYTGVAAWTVAPTFEDGAVSSFHSRCAGSRAAPTSPGVLLANVCLAGRQTRPFIVCYATLRRNNNFDSTKRPISIAGESRANSSSKQILVIVPFPSGVVVFRGILFILVKCIRLTIADAWRSFLTGLNSLADSWWLFFIVSKDHRWIVIWTRLKSKIKKLHITECRFIPDTVQHPTEATVWHLSHINKNPWTLLGL